jgi:hypothetical protein
VKIIQLLRRRREIIPQRPQNRFSVRKIMDSLDSNNRGITSSNNRHSILVSYCKPLTLILDS